MRFRSSAQQVAVALLVFAATLGVCSAAARGGQPQDGGMDVAGTTVIFASLEQSKQALREKDVWLAATSPFQRAATMGLATAKYKPGSEPGQAELQNHLETTALEWSDAESQRWHAAFTELSLWLLKPGLKNPPKRIMLVLTDGRDSANAFYTRGDTIFIPRNGATGGYSDMEIMAHEYFHVLTRAQPELAGRLYELLGFVPVGELEWPTEWLNARIVNPDAHHHQHAMMLKRDGKTLYLMPLLVARRTVLQPGETFFNAAEVRLLTVTPGHGGARSQAMRDSQGKLLWETASQSPDYLKRLGDNTCYIIHPEETAADNFAFLLSGQSVANPGLLKRFAKILGEAL